MNADYFSPTVCKFVTTASAFTDIFESELSYTYHITVPAVSGRLIGDSIMSNIIAATLGRLSPRFRTFGQWADVYEDTLRTKGLKPKTLENHHNLLRHLRATMQNDVISYIRPCSIATATRSIYQTKPNTAQRVLAEARACFAEAVAMGWTDTNPAIALRPLVSRVQRKRLSLEAWKRIRGYAHVELPPWVELMLVLAIVSGQRRGDLQKMKFSDVENGYLHVTQQKTATMIRLPIELRLKAIDTSLEEAIEACRDYAPPGDGYLLRKSTGAPLDPASMSFRFESAREGVFGKHQGEGTPPSLHECRSLSERLYREQGVNTRILLGHKRQSMTDAYNNDRGLSDGEWKTLEL
jgi:enterobacteria phage integrase